MYKQLRFLVYILFTILLVSCGKDDKKTTTYFGGKIINPKSDKIILYANEIAIDTFLLNENNKFFAELKNIKEGLYYFIHGNENQYMYLEPKDSLLIRLNTWDFDESLVFAGKGADRNNILIDCFLETEKDDKLFYQYNKLNPKAFQSKIDSIKKIKYTTLQQYLENHPNETEGFEKILNVALTYPLYARIEKYPLVYSKKTDVNIFPELEKSFYNHRKNIEFNDSSLFYYPPYSYFIRNYLYNKTYSLGHPPLIKEYTSKFTVDLLNTINSEISSETSRNAFLKQTVISHFYNKSSSDINGDTFDRYFELTTNEADKKEIQNLINDTKAIGINDKFPNFKITDYTNKEHDIKDVIKNKNVLLLFWNPNNVSEWYIKSRIEYLANKFQNIDFIQIKIHGELEKSIKNLDIKNQYYLNSNSEAFKYLSSKMPRSILVNKDGIVANGYASISSYNLNSYLKNLNSYKN